MTGIIVFFEKKIISCACFVISGLNDIFHWQAQCLILTKSSLRFLDDIAELVIVEESEVSSANSFALQHSPCGKSLI